MPRRFQRRRRLKSPPRVQQANPLIDAREARFPGVGRLCLASRDCTLGDLAVAAHLSAIDYFGEVPWAEFPAIAEWYMRIKSRPSFRTLLGDRIPGQPPVSHYADLDA